MEPIPGQLALDECLLVLDKTDVDVITTALVTYRLAVERHVPAGVMRERAADHVRKVLAKVDNAAEALA